MATGVVVTGTVPTGVSFNSASAGSGTCSTQSGTTVICQLHNFTSGFYIIDCFHGNVQGVHPRYIMDLLGHSSISITMNTYGHVLEEMKAEPARQMDALLGGAAVKMAVKLPAEKVN